MVRVSPCSCCCRSPPTDHFPRAYREAKTARVSSPSSSSTGLVHLSILSLLYTSFQCKFCLWFHTSSRFQARLYCTPPPAPSICQSLTAVKAALPQSKSRSSLGPSTKTRKARLAGEMNPAAIPLVSLMRVSKRIQHGSGNRRANPSMNSRSGE